MATELVHGGITGLWTFPPHLVIFFSLGSTMSGGEHGRDIFKKPIQELERWPRGWKLYQET